MGGRTPCRAPSGGAGVAAGISGPAEVTDGDTLVIGAINIRLHGIDAPETDQRCGLEGGGDWACGAAAADAAGRAGGGRDVRCTPRDRDGYGRLVATCAVSGVDLGARWSPRAWPGPIRATASTTPWSRAAPGAPASASGKARRSRPGTSAPTASRPPPAARRPPPGGCAIKGNITASGERVYHTPSSPWYARTRVEVDRGEHWFCDAAEAEAAGWRAAR